MSGQSFQGKVLGEFQIVAFRSKADGDSAMLNDEGSWCVQQNCIFDLMHERALYVATAKYV